MAVGKLDPSDVRRAPGVVTGATAAPARNAVTIPPSMLAAEVRRSTRDRQTVVARWLRELSRRRS
ncbi:MAG TPA: hypothetical protein VM266_14235 [Solirubrobacteraceae bacterium]|nr:hypothetical protein [Solirubrobacteraceae bacterium]